MERPNNQNNYISIEKEQSQRTNTTQFKTYLKAMVVKALWLLVKEKTLDQQNRIESPEIDPHQYSEIIFDKVAKAIRWRRDSLFNKQMVLKQLGIHMQKVNLDTDFTLFIKISSK